MRIINLHGQHGNSLQRHTIRLSQAELQALGDKAGHSEESEPAVENNANPIVVRMEINVEKYTDRTWAVYVNGKLLCVTAYRKGAYAVMDLLNQLWSRIVRQEGEGRTLIREMEASKRVFPGINVHHHSPALIDVERIDASGIGK